MRLGTLLKWWPEQPTRPNGVDFVHHKPKIPNLGDSLCSPSNYFRFKPRKTAGRIVIIGGGAFPNFAIDHARKNAADHRISWAIGSSNPSHRTPAAPDCKLLLAEFDHASTRDPESAQNGMVLVPCPSSFHPICEIPQGEYLGLFLNADPKASGDNPDSLLAKYAAIDPTLVIGSNAMNDAEFAETFSQTNRIVTNSYHIAYWSLLAGRAVTIVGYSSKFFSLLNLFEQNADEVIFYRKGNQAELTVAIDTALSEPPRISVTNFEAIRRRFCDINLSFASALVKTGLFKSIKRK